MVLPLAIFLYAYYAFLAIWLLFSLVGVYHVVKFSQVGLTSFLAVVLYAGGSLAILNYSYLFLSQVDWEVPVNILGGLLKANF